eukprot:gene11681-14865_t
MLPNHHITKPVYIGEIQGDGQFNVVWKTDGLVPGEAWSKYLEGSKTLVADWVKYNCGNYDTVKNRDRTTRGRLRAAGVPITAIALGATPRGSCRRRREAASGGRHPRPQRPALLSPPRRRPLPMPDRLGRPQEAIGVAGPVRAMAPRSRHDPSRHDPFGHHALLPASASRAAARRAGQIMTFLHRLLVAIALVASAAT